MFRIKNKSDLPQGEGLDAPPPPSEGKCAVRLGFYGGRWFPGQIELELGLQ